MHVIENGQGLLPCAAGGLLVACAVAGVAEMNQDDGLPVAFLALGQQFQGVPVAGSGLLVLAELVMDVAQAVPGVRLV